MADAYGSPVNRDYPPLDIPPGAPQQSSLSRDDSKQLPSPPQMRSLENVPVTPGKYDTTSSKGRKKLRSSKKRHVRTPRGRSASRRRKRGTQRRRRVRQTTKKYRSSRRRN